MTKKVCRRILAVELIILALVWLDVLYIKVAHRIPYKQCEQRVVYYIDERTIHIGSKPEAREKIEDIVGVHHYFYTEKELPVGTNGLTILMARYVLIDYELDNIDYVIALTHELLHIKYNCEAERFIQFKTFECLYNSEFRDIALIFASQQTNGYYIEDYNCGQYIVEYLKENKIIC